MFFPEKHQQIVRMGSKNSEQKGAAKVVAMEIEKLDGRGNIVRVHEIRNNGECIFVECVVVAVVDL